MSNIKVKPGMRFGRLTVIRQIEFKRPKWECRCDCGNIVEVLSSNLTSNHTISCGCAHITHGMSDSRQYRIYQGMKQRCTNERCAAYQNYGARGIYICEEWAGKNDFPNFQKWISDNINDPINGYNEFKSIDRIDVNGPYAPWNCRWVYKDDQDNNRRSNVFITFNGETHTIAEWSKILLIPDHVIWYRYINNWNTEDVLDPNVRNHIRYVDYDGMQISINDLADKYNINKHTLIYRLDKLEMDIYQALNTPVMEHSKYITYDGATYSYSEWERIRGLKQGVLISRLRRGWTEEEALNGKANSKKPPVPINAIYFIDENNNPIPQDKYDDYLKEKESK